VGTAFAFFICLLTFRVRRFSVIFYLTNFLASFSFSLFPRQIATVKAAVVTQQSFLLCIFIFYYRKRCTPAALAIIKYNKWSK